VLVDVIEDNDAGGELAAEAVELTSVDADVEDSGESAEDSDDDRSVGELAVEPMEAGELVAVNTGSGRPPHRSQRAGLPHWAPTSGMWRRSGPPGKGALRGRGVAIGSRCGPSVPR